MTARMIGKSLMKQNYLKKKSLGKHHDLNLKSDTLLWLIFLKTLEKCV